MKKKVLLVKASNPTKFNNLLTFPLGLMYLAAYLKNKRREVDIRILDMRVSSKDLLHSTLKEFSPDIVGISAITLEEKSMMEIAAAVKAERPDSVVVAGGPHASAFGEEVLKNRNIDFIVRGEGEKTFLELFNLIIDGGDRYKIRGIGFRDNGSIVMTEDRENIKDLDSLPFPAYDLLDPAPYFKKTSMSNYGIRRYANVFTSRSCPYQCIYCHNIFGKGFRGRSPENVIEEIKILKKNYDIEEVEIVDDVFNFDKMRAMNIFSLSLEENLNVKYSFPNGLRGDRLDDDLIRVMKDGGTVMVTVAVESASEKIQKRIKKNLKLEKVFTAIETLNNMDILSRGFFMLGFPGETDDEMRMTVAYACATRLHIAMFYLAIPFKGTELYEMVKDRIDLNKFSTQDYEYVSSRFNLSDVPYERLLNIQAGAYRKFYSNPWRWWRILRLSPYKKDLLRYLPDLFLRFFLDRR